jgi:hypothetical protein
MQRVNKIKAVNRKKKMLVDTYIKNAQIIEQAFDQMKEYSGISNIEEIVTTYIKAEDQNYSLYNYVNMLGQENDAYDENIKNQQEQIGTYKHLDEMNEQQKKQEINELKAKRDSLIQQKEDMGYEGKQIQKEFKDIQHSVGGMVELFNKAKFSATVANQYNYGDDIQFNESNILQYLSEAEENIAQLVTFIAFRNGDSHPAISSVPLNRLTVKQFAAKDMSIDAPVDLDIETDNTSHLPDDQGGVEDKYYGIINSKELYSKYQELKS